MTDAPTARLLHPAHGAATLVALFGGATIAGAWGFELIGGLEPCPLCLEQRWPYYLGVPVALLAAALASRGRIQAAGWLLVVTALLMAWGAGLGVYHSGIEWHWWQGPAACSGGSGGIGFSTNVEDLRASLAQGTIPSCADAPWRLFGLSLAGYNALASAGLALVAAAGAWSALARR